MPRPYNTKDKFSHVLGADKTIELLGHELRLLRNEIKKLQSERDYYRQRCKELEIPEFPLPQGNLTKP